MRKCLMCHERNIDYYGLCGKCKEVNRQMRELSCSLDGKYAVVTGGRIKIGYAAALKLLRWGASVIAVTRYPKNALENYMKEPDYEDFRHRLFIIGFDLLRADMIDRLIVQIEEICGGSLDILINNAAQTVKKSAEYYSALEAKENRPGIEAGDHIITRLNVPDAVQLFPAVAAAYSSAPLTAAEYGETPYSNSWVRKPEDISPRELLEVQLINVTAPFLLTNGLRSALERPDTPSFVINVSSVEGRFNHKQKLARHVHTNMAKASLNMMTHSIASDFARSGIYVYSCDPGWVSNQFPPEYEVSRNFTPYLTFEDGAMRILYPIVKNLNAERIADFGKFYKDYTVIEH